MTTTTEHATPGSGPSRRLIVCNIVSLDGSFTGADGNPGGLPMDHAFDQYNAERLATADTLLLGRSTYDLFRGFWPAMQHHPEASEAHRTISRRDDEIDKVVVSDSITVADTDPWTDSTTIVRRDDAVRSVTELKATAGGDILMFGSRTLWTRLREHGLVDEFHLMIGSVVLAGGVPAFTAPRAAPMPLIATRTWEGSANVLAVYDAR